MKTIYNKLVRDNIPTIIEKNNKKSKIRILDENEYIIELKKKLMEESNEVHNANSKQEILEEIADVYEVIDALMNIYHISKEEVLDIKEKKAIKNGKFNKKIFLEYVIKNED